MLDPVPLHLKLYINQAKASFIRFCSFPVSHNPILKIISIGIIILKNPGLLDSLDNDMMKSTGA
jgi:hypothetical protein